MKSLSSFCLFIIVLLAFSSCSKKDWDKDCGFEKDYNESKFEEGKDWEVKEWDASELTDANGWDRYELEPLITDPSCGCIVSGIEKYAMKAEDKDHCEDDEFDSFGVDFEGDNEIFEEDVTYLIKYGDGECDNEAYLITYHNGKHKWDNKCNEEVAKIELDCSVTK